MGGENVTLLQRDFRLGMQVYIILIMLATR